MSQQQQERITIHAKLSITPPDQWTPEMTEGWFDHKDFIISEPHEVIIDPREQITSDQTGSHFQLEAQIKIYPQVPNDVPQSFVFYTNDQELWPDEPCLLLTLDIPVNNGDNPQAPQEMFEYAIEAINHAKGILDPAWIKRLSVLNFSEPTRNLASFDPAQTVTQQRMPQAPQVISQIFQDDGHTSAALKKCWEKAGSDYYRATLNVLKHYCGGKTGKARQFFSKINKLGAGPHNADKMRKIIREIESHSTKYHNTTTLHSYVKSQWLKAKDDSNIKNTGGYTTTLEYAKNKLSQVKPIVRPEFETTPPGYDF